MDENKQIDEMAEMLEIIAKAREDYANDVTDRTENEYIREGLLDAGYDRVHIGAPGGARKLMEDAPIADVVLREEVAKIFEAIEISIFKLETPYQTLHCIPSGFIEELKVKYTKGGEQK